VEGPPEVHVKTDVGGNQVPVGVGDLVDIDCKTNEFI
jgi:hypothetical protein